MDRELIRDQNSEEAVRSGSFVGKRIKEEGG